MKQKRLDYEIMRLLAIVLVVFNHTQEWGYELWQAPGCSGVNYALSLGAGIICNAAVPLFLLVSGGLLLHREEPLSRVLIRRAGRILIVLALFSGVLYLFWIAWGYVETPSLRDFLRRVWTEGISRPYWYLYAYLGLMLILPLLRALVRGMDNRAFLYLTALHLGYFGILGTLGHLMGPGEPNPSFALYLVEPCVFYFLMGDYLARRFPWERFRGRHLLYSGLAAVAAVAVMFGLATVLHRRLPAGELIELEYQRSLMLFPVFFLYALVRYLVERHPLPERAGKVVAELGRCVFGAYLLEGILRHSLQGIYTALQPRIHVLPACALWVLAVVVLGLGLTAVLRRVPGLRKIL